LGQINFLFDKDNKPYASADDFANWFEISKSLDLHRDSNIF
jgi:hypothetical protein